MPPRHNDQTFTLSIDAATRQFASCAITNRGAKLTSVAEEFADASNGELLGLRGREAIVVDEGTAISFLGKSARVLGTPWMILWMERTARGAIQLRLPAGWDSVGTAVDIRHLAAAPMGVTVIFDAEVIEVKRTRIRFKVRAALGEIVIGEGTHERALIDVERFASHLEAGSTPC